MAVAGFAVLESQAAECSTRSRRGGRCTEHGGEVSSLVGVQDLDGLRLLQWSLPRAACVLAVVSMLHRVGGVVLWICVNSPPLDLGGILGCTVHNSSSSLRSGRWRHQHRLDALV